MQHPIQVSLLILRLTIVIFFAVWAGEKFVSPETTIAIYSHFYFIEGVPTWGIYLVGVFQSAIILAALFGFQKFWSYGFLMVMHGVTTLASWQQILAPYDGGNHLFVAAIPVLGGLIALFLLRHEDTLCSPLSQKSNAV